MKILFCFFSATKNTRLMAGVIASHLIELNAATDTLDITTPAARESLPDFSQYDAAVFGAPIHSMRAPRLMREWISRLKGNGTPAAMFFTYGGFQIHPAHFDTRERLSASGFKVLASADFPAAHTFNLGGWQAMTDRPGEADFDLARKYAGILYDRFSGKDPGVLSELDPGPYSQEQLDQFEDFRFKAVSVLPNRNGKECQMCGLCEEQCPAGAILAETGQAERGKCIACLACVQACPDQVLEINDLSGIFKAKMENDSETMETMAQKTGHLYL